MTQRWLILSYFAGVDALSCSHHLDDRLPELRRQGVEPILVNSVCAPVIPDYAQTRVVSPLPSGLRFEFRYTSRRLFPNDRTRRLVTFPVTTCLLPFYGLESLVLNFDSTWSWFLTAQHAAMRLIRRYQIDLIYSTGGPSCVHRAACWCAQRTGLPWIAEFQDPIVGEWEGKTAYERRYLFNLEGQVARHAGAAIYLTRRALESAQARHDLDANGHYLYPGAREDIFTGAAQPPTASFKIGHVGTLSGSRTSRELFRACEALLAKYPAAKNELSLLLVGHMDGPQRALIDGFSTPQALDIRPKCSREAALQALQQCTLLALIQNASSVSSETIPGKTYEYLQAGVPIFALTYDNAELNAMLQGLGHYAVDLRDDHAVFTALERLYLAWRTQHRLVSRLKTSPYTAGRAVGQLCDIAAQITPAAPRTPALV